MTQTLAMLLDAYRELRSRKLFWITMALSALVVLVFAGFGINEKGLTFLRWEWDLPVFNSKTIPPEKFYKFCFATFAVPIWLAWIATILALISTAGIFPEFLAGGAIEMTLSKPISRLRLFLTKYACGLLFVGLQVLVFSGACFLVIGLRGKSWEPSLFLAVPIVVAFFSYLFAMCVLLGMLTRSTIASLLLTILMWVALWAVNTTDGVFLMQRETSAVNAERTAKRLVRSEANAKKTLDDRTGRGEAIPAHGGDTGFADALEAVSPGLRIVRKESRDDDESAANWRLWSDRIRIAKTILPKTQETVQLLDRWLVSPADKELITNQHGEDGDADGRARFGTGDPEVARRMEAALRDRTVWWVLGTSFAFEGLILSLAAWIFCRRDF